MPERSELDELRDELRKFADERDWQQFHSPKNLAMALSVEAAELLELFQWKTEDETRALNDADRARAREEIADVFLYLISLADQLGIDLAAAANHKLGANAEKYPIAKSFGTSKKYTEL